MILAMSVNVCTLFHADQCCVHWILSQSYLEEQVRTYEEVSEVPRVGTNEEIVPTNQVSGLNNLQSLHRNLIQVSAVCHCCSSPSPRAHLGIWTAHSQ